ncbi:MAG: translation elongation factor Ts [Planctomycetaceae bacterium]|jgi:elongation factor Ts|nr:translation elongation factor Ts [Planctomycetaceae bacterium]MBT6155912.1 translation elongation factor Ts [Planctomycetaceae bacterium]MBT6483173.1 translation elongation factor Ts [Planctomycetaceae bacterium]MBT6495177.1 translation elongation factor Ts [Planctomycetaceae bacterium]
MAEITAAAVKALRERTDMPMMKCKQALVEAGGDEEKAVDILKQEAGKILDKRKDNATSEGRIFITTTDDGSEAAMVEVCCESAPVGSGEHLGSLGDLLVKQLLEGPGAATADELLDQDAPDGSGQTLRAIYEKLLATIREKISVGRITRLEGPIGGYVHHDGKTGALLQATGEDGTAAVLRDVAMHIAALKPAVADVDGLDPAVVQAERDRLTEDAKATGKPDNIVEKIVEGQMKKFYDEQGVLVYQAFAKDDSKSVSQALADSGLTAKAFTCWVLGN